MNYWKIPLVCIAGALLAAASCGHPGNGGTGTGTGGSTGSGGTGNCTPGTVGCSCNGTSCDQGLQCANVGAGQTQCVSVGSGSGGTTGTGGDAATGGSTGTGGTTGTGGNVSTGGTTGSGGSSSGGTTGSGGNGSGGNGSGGTTGSGGSSSGGTTGSGGTGSGTNLIINGDFSQGMTNWGIPNGSPMNPTYNNQLCMTVSNSSGQVVVGWGGDQVSANVQANVNYTLSFQASASSALSGFDTHLGSAVSVGGSYPVDKDFGNDNVGNSLQTFTHQFSLTTADAQAGIAFLISASNGNPMVCIDNVSLIAN